MRNLVQSSLVLAMMFGAGACNVPPDRETPLDRVELERCDFTDDPLEVGDETTGIDGPVTVTTSERDGRVTLSITPDDVPIVHTATFDLAGAAFDEPVGQVTAQVGVVFAGEGSEYGYLRLTDERGVWFEGGLSGFIDGVAQGGSAIDGPFVLGDEIGEECRGGGLEEYDLALHNVLVAVDEGGDPVLLDAAGTDVSWRGVDVRAVGVRADSGVYVESDSTFDGLGPGEHEEINVLGYLYRVRP